MDSTGISLSLEVSGAAVSPIGFVQSQTKM